MFFDNEENQTSCRHYILLLVLSSQDTYNVTLCYVLSYYVKLRSYNNTLLLHVRNYTECENILQECVSYRDKKWLLASPVPVRLLLQSLMLAVVETLLFAGEILTFGR